MQTLNQAVKKDVWYNDLLLEYVKYEEAYCRIRNALSQANQDILEEFLSARSWNTGGAALLSNW